MAKFKPYQSLFGENTSKKQGKKSTAVILKKAIRELALIKKDLRKLREEDEVDASTIDDAVDKIEDVLTDVIDDLGASDPAVAALIDTVQDLEASDEEEFDFDDSDDFMEAEEDSDDVEEITDGVMQKVDEEDEEDSEEDEDGEEKKESIKKYKKNR